MSRKATKKNLGTNGLTDIDCAETEVKVKLKELKPDKATGSHGFLPKVVNAVADGVVLHLCQIFNRSLTSRRACRL